MVGKETLPSSLHGAYRVLVPEQEAGSRDDFLEVSNSSILLPVPSSLEGQPVTSWQCQDTVWRLQAVLIEPPPSLIRPLL